MKRKGFSKLLCGVFAPLLMVLLIVLIFSVPVSATVNSSNIGYTLYTSATSDDVWENEATITTNAQPGMVADGAGSVAHNNANVVTTGDGAFGMYALNTGTVLNHAGGLVRTNGEGSHGMVADGTGSTATNEFGAEVRTTGPGSFGMLATGGSVATNLGRVVTTSDDSHGMYAFGGSTIYNTNAGDNRGVVRTEGAGSHGMVADGSGSTAHVNSSNVVTNGDNSFGMYALNGGLVYNHFGGLVRTNGTGSHGMVADGAGSRATNEGDADVLTTGDGSFGMFATNGSEAENLGRVVTRGDGSHGMYAFGGSTVNNNGSGAVRTEGAWSHGMVANVGSYAYNDGSIITHGGNAYGMAAVGLSSADNYGDIVTGGSDSYGMLAWDSSEALNAGSITTTGDNAWGMLLIEGSTGTNNGTITTTGIDSHAVRLDDSDFINTGTLDSAQGFAVAASNNSNVTLLDDTVLAGSRVLADLDGTYDGRDSLSGTSTLTVDMDADIDAVVAGFGEFTKRGDGTMLIEAGSWAGDTRHEAGMLKIEGMTQFVTETYDQEEGARLYLYANPFSATDPDAIPLWVSGDAWMDGSMRADMTSATGVGFYNFIRATYYEGEPVTTFENLDPLFLAYGPAWVDGWDNDYHYRTLLGYSFSEAALGLVAAVDDWNMLRWIMGNHLQDVAESMKEMEVGEKKIHAHALGGTTSRDPADSASAGFDSTQKGISVGFDKKSNDNTVWGLYAGYTEKDIDFTGLPMVGSDWESQDTWHIGGYISKKWDRWIFSNTLTFRSTDHKTFRVQMGGDATASFDSWAITNDLRLGYVAKEIGEGSNWQVIPEVGLNVGYFDRGGYTEKNGFTYGDFDTTVVESVLGVRFRGEYERANGSKFVPQARLAWVHVLSGGDITIDQSWGGTTHWFTEYLDDDYFVADLGLSLYNMNDMDISLNYGGRFSDNSTTHGGWLRLEWRF